MALSTGQINDAFLNALGRPPTQQELLQYSQRGDLEGSSGQQTLIGEIGGTSAGATSLTVKTPEQMANESILGAYRNLVSERNKRFKEYEGAKGPFDLDEVLVAKRAEAKEQIDPYYNETLSDYLLGVQRKKERSQADTQELLGELSASEDSFTGSTKLKLDEAINRAQEGFAEAGLFDSGARFRTEGLLGRESADQSEDFLRRSRLKRRGVESGLARTLEDVGLEAKGKERDIERSRFTDIETRAGGLAKEAGERYVTEFQQTLPPELQANQNFDILKSIGIYS